jgi:methylglutaconyl-CoA hydratase
MLKVQREGPVLRVVLDRPEVRNAIDDALIARLTDTLESVADPIRTVVLSGEGRSFCAGGDLEWMRRAASFTEEQNYEDALRLGRLFTSVARCRAVVVCRVHGAAFGGGAGLVAASDVAVCECEALFSFSEVRLGLIPATITPFVIPKIGAGHSRALFSTGEAFGAEHALRIGLVHAAVPMSELDDAIEQKIKAILSVGPNAAMEAKLVALDGPVPMEEAARRLARVRSGEEAREGVAAFLEKRKANYVVER